MVLCYSNRKPNKTPREALAITLSLVFHPFSMSPLWGTGKLLSYWRRGRIRREGTFPFLSYRAAQVWNVFVFALLIAYRPICIYHHFACITDPLPSPSHHRSIRVILVSLLTFPSRIVYFREETFDKAQSNFKYMICHVHTCHLSYALRSDLPAFLLTFRGTVKASHLQLPCENSAFKLLFLPSPNFP